LINSTLSAECSLYTYSVILLMSQLEMNSTDLQISDVGGVVQQNYCTL